MDVSATPGPSWSKAMRERDVPLAAQAIVRSRAFFWTVMAAIVAGALVVGLETSTVLMARYGGVILTLDWIIIGIFVVEAALKMLQHGARFHRYFRDPWNVFDFVIVVICLLPIGGHYAAVLRLARVVRTLRLVSAVPRLQLLVTALLKSIPAMVYVGLLLGILFYVYAVLGVFLFRDNDPVHFGTLKLSLLSLFRVVTLEDWTDIMYIQMYGSDVYAIENSVATPAAPKAQPLIAIAYFVSFVLIGTMVVLNLFIGVIINSMHEAQEEHEARRRARDPEAVMLEELHELQEKMQSLQRSMRSFAQTMSRRKRES